MMRGTELPEPKDNESNPFLTEDGKLQPGILPPDSKVTPGKYIERLSSYALAVMGLCACDEMLAKGSTTCSQIADYARMRNNLVKIESWLVEIIEGE